MTEQDRIRLDREASEMEERVLALVKSKFPMKLQGGVLDVTDLKIERPEGFLSLTAQHKLKMEDGSLYGALRGRFVLSDEKGKVLKRTGEQDIVSTIPYKTVRGSYIAGGNERTISAQLRRAPGIYTERSGNEVETKIYFNANDGLWTAPLTMHYNPSKGKFYVHFRSSNKAVDLSGITFLTDIVGASATEVRNVIGSPEIFGGIMEKQNSYGTSVASVYPLFFKDEKFNGTPDQIVKLRDRLMEQPNFGLRGEKRVQATVGVSSNKFDKSVVLASVAKLFSVFRNEANEDDSDDLRFKIVLNDQDFILKQLGDGIDEFKVKVNYRSTVDNDLRFIVATPLANLDRKIDRFVKADTRNSPEATGIVEAPETTNPLNLLSSTMKVTQRGEGGLSEDAVRNANSERNIQATAITRIDPVESPESDKIGLVRHLARNAKVTNGTIVSKFFKVTKGTASTEDNNIVELDPFEEYDSYCAFYNPGEITKLAHMIAFKKPMVAGRYQGKIMEIPREDVQYVDTAPSDIFGYASSLIPFGDHNDGNRMLMGTNMQKQGLLLQHSVREAPLVQVAIDSNKDKTFEDEVGEKANAVIAPEAGVIESIDKGHINLKGVSGKLHKIEYYDHFPMNQDNFINNDLLVKVGDKVEAGQLIAEGWQTKDGKLALGLNARVAFMPYKGWNYEDGVVVSRDFANRVVTDELESRDVTIYSDWIGGPGDGAKEKYMVNTARTAGLQKLDKDGIIKPGEEVGPGDILVAALKPKEKDFDMQRRFSNMIIRGNETEWEDAAEKIGEGEYLSGKVLDVNILPGSASKEADAKCVIRIRVKMSKPLKIGDKISGRHGNKGTITKILNAKEMPYTEDGRQIDLMFSPLVVPSRKNVGQLLEVNAGTIAERTGKPYKVYNFDPKETEAVKKGLEKVGVPDGKMTVIDPDTKVPYENQITVGPMYIMKLKHKVDEKLQARSYWEGKFNEKYLSPEKSTGEAAGEKANPQRLGEMEMRALQANQAPFNILETTTLKGDGAGFVKDRLDIYRALSTGDKTALTRLRDKSGVPESLRILKNKMFAMGMQITPMNHGKKVQSLDDTFGELMLTPTRDEDILRAIGVDKKVTKAETYQSVDKRPGAPGDEVKSDKAVPGGLYDTAIFGPEERPKNGAINREVRNKWGYIELTTPMPNPILLESPEYNPYALLLGLKKSQLQDIMSKDFVVITNPGSTGMRQNDIVPAEDITAMIADGNVNFEYKVGGEALMYLLSKINVAKELASTGEALKAAKPGDKDALYKKYRVLQNFKANNLKPTDLMTRIVPVTPKYLRPRIAQGRQVIENGITKIYSNLVDVNENSRVALECGTPVDRAKQSNGIYRAMKYLYGGFDEKYEDKKKKEYVDGIINLIGGKEGLIRDKMLGKRVDYSGRAVIGVDPTLKINEVGLPADIAKTVYAPFIIKKLIERGFVPNNAVGEKMAKSKIARFDDDVKKILDDIAEERPVMINRAPTLHKFSIQAFKPVVRTMQDGQVVRNIQLNPMVVTGFSADFDGDQMGVHVPLSDDAVEEAKTLMMPSDNFINPTNGSMIIEIRHEMALGIYYLTMNPEQTVGKNITYRTPEQLRADYDAGKITAKQAITLYGKSATAGQWLFFSLIPEPYRSKYFGQTMGSGNLKTLMRQMYDDIIYGKNTRMGTIDLSNLIDQIKELGFAAATRSGLSIGVKDLELPADFKGDIIEKGKAIDNKLKGDEQGLIGGYINLEKEIEAQLKKGALGSENPATIMMQSGARGDATQIRRMGALVGVGRDIENNLMPPIKSSHLEGLSPSEYYIHSYDALKGMADRTLSTEAPGTLTRELWSAYQDKLITEDDCGTEKGIPIHKDSKIVGRYAAKAIRGADGTVYVKAGDAITVNAQALIVKDDSINYIDVRSPATCATINGICQKCYGWEAGKTQPPKLGYPAGVIASQAIGEPVTQMTMKTFHTGGTSSNVTLGLPRITEILHPESSKLSNIAVIAKNSGRVASIVNKENGTEVTVGKKVYNIPLDEYGYRKPLRVNVGDEVISGQFLTRGNVEDINEAIQEAKKTGKTPTLTSARPLELMKYNPDKQQGLYNAQNYMINGMQYAIDSSLGKQDYLDRRHIELTVGKLTENVKVVDGGDSPFMDGQVVKRNEVERWNANNVTMAIAKPVSTSNMDRCIGAIAGEIIKDRQGHVLVKPGETITKDVFAQIMLTNRTIKITPRPVIYENIMTSPETAAEKGHDNWFSNLGHEDIKNQMARGLSFGQVDKLEDPRSRMMAGKLSNIGQKGFGWWQKVKSGVSDFANNVGNSILNMFQNHDQR